MKIIVFNINQKTVFRGTEVFWNNLLKELEKHECQVQILSSDEKKIQNKSASILFKILRRFYLDGYSLNVLFFTLGNIKHVIRSKPDIIIPTNGGWQTLIVRFLKTIFHYKIVIIGHAGIGHDDKFNVKHGGVDLFVALTHEQEVWARRLNHKIRVEYIPDGIDVDLFSPAGEKFIYRLPRPIFLAVASLEKYKHLDKTIVAVSELEKGSLVIIGAGREKDNLDRLCREKLPGCYLIISVAHDDIPKYYRGADVFTLVSGHQEAFGLVYLEAMAVEKPVVATDDEKRREIVGEAGVFVDPDKLDEYKTALMKSAIIDWDDKPRRQAEKFSWENVGRKYSEVLKQLVKL